VFGLLISQRPRMLDIRPAIDFSIFISLGIFKVVSLFNYQFSFVSLETAYLLYLIHSILSRTFLSFFTSLDIFRSFSAMFYMLPYSYFYVNIIFSFFYQ
ncbi:MAG: hypothetical protein KH020_16935, partial [Clostridiales bacterium]|nr:hypothetical protein [Clostridiales bacterium]